MKKRSTILVAVLLLAALVTALGVTASADDSTYTAVSGTNVTFDKVLIVDEEANILTYDFSFSIASGTAVSAVPGTKMAIYAGNDGQTSVGAPAIVNNADSAISVARFAPGHATVDNDGTWATVATGRKAAIEKMKVDFSSVSFKEPGIYRWIITETSADQQGITYDTQRAQALAHAADNNVADNGVAKQRVLDVYVTDNGSGTLQVSSYVLHECVNDVSVTENYGSDPVPSASPSPAPAVSDKSQGFVNEYETYNLEISKTVSGNQASRDKYFKFTVAIANAGATNDFDIVITDAAKTPSASAATTYEQSTMQNANTADDDNTVNGQQWKTVAAGTVSHDVYLKHGQSVQIKGLPVGATYTITETPEDYLPSATREIGEAAAAAVTLSNNAVTNPDGGLTADTVVAFTNTRAGTVPTGVMLTVVPGVAIVAIALVGLFVLKRKKEDA